LRSVGRLTIRPNSARWIQRSDRPAKLSPNRLNREWDHENEESARSEKHSPNLFFHFRVGQALKSSYRALMWAATKSLALRRFASGESLRADSIKTRQKGSSERVVGSMRGVGAC
jgi:hypothetical protein